MASRQMTFTIPGNPPVKVTAIENNGSLQLTLAVQATSTLAGNLRALYFDFNESKMRGLAVSESGTAQISKTMIGANTALDLGLGTSLASRTTSKFDVGLLFGATGTSTGGYATQTFTLTNAANNLTLEDIAGQRFGAQLGSVGLPGKGSGTTIDLGLASAAPAAAAVVTPSTGAKADTFSIQENGAGSGVQSIGQVAGTATAQKSVAVKFDVLANDVAGAAGGLTIVSNTAAGHGTVTIAADGKSMLYKPNFDFYGTDSFTYSIKDSLGKVTSATVSVNVAEVARAPSISMTTSAGANDDPNVTVIHIIATPYHKDGSEAVTKISYGALPPGVTISAGAMTVDAMGVAHQDFTVTNVATRSAAFDIAFTAVDTVKSNGSTASAVATQHIDYGYTKNVTPTEFVAIDQSIWGTGNALKLDYSKFFGIDESGSVGPGWVALEYGIKVGLEAEVHLTSGDISAYAGYLLNSESKFNRTTDVLQIATSAEVTTTHFDTQGPGGSAYLGALAEFRAALTYDITIDSGSIFDFSAGFEYALVDISSSDPNAVLEKELPSPLDVFNVKAQFPTITTSGSSSGTGVTTSNGLSNDFVTLQLDTTKLITKIVENVLTGGAAEAFDSVKEVLEDLTGAEIDDLFNISFTKFGIDFTINFFKFLLNVGLAFEQDFTLKQGNVGGTLTLEDGAHQAFTFGDTLNFLHASSHDVNHDGKVDYTFDVAPEATLTNVTSLTPTYGYDLILMKLQAKIETAVVSFEANVGPVYEDHTQYPIVSIPLYENTFALNFQHDSFHYAA